MSELLQSFLDERYELFLVVGDASTGKTQLVEAYRQAVLPGLKGAAPSGGGLSFHAVSAGRRKAALVDVSAELVECLRPGGAVDREALGLFRRLRPRLRGLALLADPRRLWSEGSDSPPRSPQGDGGGASSQVELLTWILVLLRWLRQAGDDLGDGRLSFRDHVLREVVRTPRRLEVPVLVLFSRADEANGLAVPRLGEREGFRTAEGRTLYPVGEEPLLLAYHGLPELYGALLTHADHFRFDFAHALVTDPDTGEIVDPLPCGVVLSLDWLLDDRWRLPAVPTRTWIAVERFVDEKLRGSDRWRRLADPVELV